MSRLRHVAVLSILPREFFPAVLTFANDTIFDPQFWDLDEVSTNPRNTPLLEFPGLGAARRGRRVLISLGRQDDSKGTRFLVRIWLHSPEIREKYLFALCGQVGPSIRDSVSEFAQSGGWIADRRLDDSELLASYRAADLVWCCYHPEWDKSSGIFGRSCQFGVPTVVRCGAKLSMLQPRFSHGLQLAFDDCPAAARKLLEYEDFERRLRIPASDLRERSVRRLHQALAGSARSKGR